MIVVDVDGAAVGGWMEEQHTLKGRTVACGAGRDRTAGGGVERGL